MIYSWNEMKFVMSVKKRSFTFPFMKKIKSSLKRLHVFVFLRFTFHEFINDCYVTFWDITWPCYPLCTHTAYSLIDTFTRELRKQLNLYARNNDLFRKSLFTPILTIMKKIKVNLLSGFTSFSKKQQNYGSPFNFVMTFLYCHRQY